MVDIPEEQNVLVEFVFHMQLVRFIENNRSLISMSAIESNYRLKIFFENKGLKIRV